MSCSCDKCAVILITSIAISLFCLDICIVKLGGLDSFIYGKDFKNKSCDLVEGKQHFEMKIPYKPKSYHLNRAGSNLLQFFKLPELSVCVSKCPYHTNTTDLLLDSGYGRLFDTNGDFICGKLPDYVGPYQLQGGRCNPKGTIEVYFSSKGVFHQEKVCYLVFHVN